MDTSQAFQSKPNRSKWTNHHSRLHSQNFTSSNLGLSEKEFYLSAKQTTDGDMSSEDPTSGMISKPVIKTHAHPSTHSSCG
jgi:hypothetical protein